MAGKVYFRRNVTLARLYLVNNLYTKFHENLAVYSLIVSYGQTTDIKTGHTWSTHKDLHIVKNIYRIVLQLSLL
jgi:hypothetical protein